MPEELTVSFSYQERGHGTLYGVDPQFYRQLPGVDFEYRDARSGRPELPRPDPDQWLQVAGVAVVALPALATIIKAWLESRRRKIVISSGKYKLEYEGPGLREDAPEIQAMIEDLTRKARSKGISITVYVVPEQSDKQGRKIS